MSFPNGLHLDDSSDTLKQYHSTEGPLEPAAHEGQLARPPADLLRRHPHQGLSAALPPLQHHLLASLSRLRLLDHDPMVHDSIPPDRRSIFTYDSISFNEIKSFKIKYLHLKPIGLFLLANNLLMMKEVQQLTIVYGSNFFLFVQKKACTSTREYRVIAK